MRLSSRAAKEVPNSGALAARPFGRYSVDLRGPFWRCFFGVLKVNVGAKGAKQEVPK